MIYTIVPEILSINWKVLFEAGFLINSPSKSLRNEQKMRSLLNEQYRSRNSNIQECRILQEEKLISNRPGHLTRTLKSKSRCSKEDFWVLFLRLWESWLPLSRCSYVDFISIDKTMRSVIFRGWLSRPGSEMPFDVSSHTVPPLF